MTKSRGLRAAHPNCTNVLINREKAARTANAAATMGQMPPEPEATEWHTRGRELINADQALILQTLLDAATQGGPSQPELERATPLARAQISRALLDLRERGLAVEATPKTGRAAIKWGVSMHGRRAFWHYMHKLQQDAERALAAPPPTYNTKGQAYVPPSNVYYRNAGHTHIASHGVRC